MSNDASHRAIELQADALGPLLHAGVASSLVSAHGRSEGLRPDKYPHLVPLLVRCDLREHLESAVLPNGWAVGGDARKMGQLLLVQPELNWEMRFLKERRRTYPNGVPIAGKNEARRQAWTNDSLDLVFSEVTISDSEPTRLLLLWDFLGDSFDNFSLRIVHTLEPGVYGKPVPCDLVIEVRDDGTIYSHLKFAGHPEDEDLFRVEIAEEEGGIDS